MTGYIVRRLLTTIPVLLGITFIVFAMVSLAPGDAISLMLGSETANVANVERLRRELGLDLPWYEQYLRYMKGLLTGDMGRSITYKRPVVDMIRERFNNTLILAASSTLFALVISLPLGIAAAYQRRSWIDYGASTLAMLGVSLPSFYLGLLLIIVFGLNLGWLPIRGMASRSASLGTYIRPILRHDFGQRRWHTHEAHALVGAGAVAGCVDRRGQGRWRAQGATSTPSGTLLP